MNAGTPLARLPDAAHLHVDGLGLNDIIEIWADEPDPECGNASHHYELRMDGKTVASISFQHGARNLEGSTPGATENAVIAILLDRLRAFNARPPMVDGKPLWRSFSCRENSVVITKLEEAMQWSLWRALTRFRQGVLGKNEVHDDGTSRRSVQ